MQSKVFQALVEYYTIYTIYYQSFRTELMPEQYKEQ